MTGIKLHENHEENKELSEVEEKNAQEKTKILVLPLNALIK